jgi:hypothetical protein
MSTSSDIAELSTVRTQVEDLTERTLEVAQRYDDTSDSAVTTELFAAERALVSASRALDRALALLA